MSCPTAVGHILPPPVQNDFVPEPELRTYLVLRIPTVMRVAQSADMKGIITADTAIASPRETTNDPAANWTRELVMDLLYTSNSTSGI